MSKPQGIVIGTVVRVVFLILIALLMFAGAAFVVVLIVFVPVIGWLVWRDQDRIASLERRLAALEGPAPPPPEKKPDEK